MTRQASKPRARIDWDEARRRLAASSPNEASRQSEVARVLAERALRLSAAIEPETDLAGLLEVLTFRAATRRYAIELRCVLEVCKCGPLTRVPGARALLRGVSSLRGDLLPVFELAWLSDGARSAFVPVGQPLLVLGTSIPELGFLVDEVEQVTVLSRASVADPKSLGALPYADFVQGITRDGCMLLDADAILADRRVFAARAPSALEPTRNRQ